MADANRERARACCRLEHERLKMELSECSRGSIDRKDHHNCIRAKSKNSRERAQKCMIA